MSFIIAMATLLFLSTQIVNMIESASIPETTVWIEGKFRTGAIID